MSISNIEAINRLNISDIDINDNSISILWIASADETNRNTLTFRFHTHTFFELHLIIEGHMLYGFENEDITIEKGKFILISPKQLHRVISHSDDFFKITVAFACDEKSDIYNVINSNKNKIVKISNDIQKSLDFISTCAKNKSFYSEILIKKRLNEMIYLIADSMPNQKVISQKYKTSDDRVLKAKKYVEDNPNIFFTCGEVALYCKLSSKHLGRLFELYEGISLLEFIHEQKIAYAKKLLLESDELQETIGKNLGFSSVHYFSKFFITHTGMTPSEYRKRYSANN